MKGLNLGKFWDVFVRGFSELNVQRPQLLAEILPILAVCLATNVGYGTN